MPTVIELLYKERKPSSSKLARICFDYRFPTPLRQAQQTQVPVSLSPGFLPHGLAFSSGLQGGKMVAIGTVSPPFQFKSSSKKEKTSCRLLKTKI